MAVKLGRPILVGGVGLSFLLWILQSLHDSVAHPGEFSIWGAIALGTGFLLFQQRTAKNGLLPSVPSVINRETVEKAIAEVDDVISQLETESEKSEVNVMTLPVTSLLREQVPQLKAEIDRQDMRIAVTGGKAVGKTTLMQVLDNWTLGQQQNISWQETLALFAGSSTGLDAESLAQKQAITSDLVLFVTTGDLTDPEFQTLKQLLASHQRLILVLNKQDQYLPEERATVLQHLRHYLQGKIKVEDVVAISSSPSPIKVRQHQPDGSVQERIEIPSPEIVSLTGRLNQILMQEGQQLVWATTWRKAVGLKAEAKTALNKVRRDRALPIIEQYQWLAAAAAFANPVPAFDLLATAAITGQMVMDLGAIYQQKFSLQQAQAVAGTMGSLMLKLGLVELTTQTIGSILKSNAITFVAGGVVQGVSAAYLTRLAGISLIEYFQEQEAAAHSETQLNLDKLGQTLQKVFQQNQQMAFLQAFIKQSVKRLMPQSPQPEIISTQTLATPL